MHINVVELSVGDHNVVTFHGDFRKAGVFKGEHCSQKKRVNKIAVIVEQLQFDCQVPSKFALDDREAFTVGGARLLEYLVDEASDLDSHLLQSSRLLTVLSRVHQRGELYVDLQIALVRLAWLRTHNL